MTTFSILYVIFYRFSVTDLPVTLLNKYFINKTRKGQITARGSLENRPKPETAQCK